MTPKPGITADELRAILAYDPETGLFTWAARGKGRTVGAVAGTVEKATGYRRIRTGGRAYQASRLAHLYMTGEWPEDEVDHRDLNKGNDRWENLRAATTSQNQANTRTLTRSQHGMKGVTKSRVRLRRPWIARLMVGGTRKCLGRFSTADEAKSAYDQALTEAFGEFARTA